VFEHGSAASVDKEPFLGYRRYPLREPGGPVLEVLNQGMNYPSNTIRDTKKPS
jgi:hypothetical protein